MSEEIEVSKVPRKQFVRFRGLAWILAGIIFLVGLGIGDMDSDYRYWVQTSWSVTAAEWAFILVYILFGKGLRSFFDHAVKGSRLVVQASMLWMLVVLVSYFLSDYYSAGNLLALTRLIETMTHFLFFVVVWDFASVFPPVRRYALWSIVAAALVSTLYYLFAMLGQPYGGGLHLAGYAWHHVGLNGNIRRVGYEIEAALVILLVLAGSTPARYRIFGWALCAGWLFFLILLGGRASLLGAFVAMALYLLYRKGWKPFLKAFTALMTIALFFLMVHYLFHIHDAYLSKMLDRTLLASSLESATSGRTVVWSMLSENLRNHWILGTGPQSYFFYPGRGSMIIHAHNFILQFLGEWGVLGTMLFIFLLGYGGMNGLKKLRVESHQEAVSRLAAGLGIAALTVTGLFGGTYFFTQTSFFLSIFYAIWVSSADMEVSGS